MNQLDAHLGDLPVDVFELVDSGVDVASLTSGPDGQPIAWRTGCPVCACSNCGSCSSTGGGCPI